MIHDSRFIYISIWKSKGLFSLDLRKYLFCLSLFCCVQSLGLSFCPHISKAGTPKSFYTIPCSFLLPSYFRLDPLSYVFSNKQQNTEERHSFRLICSLKLRTNHGKMTLDKTQLNAVPLHLCTELYRISFARC